MHKLFYEMNCMRLWAALSIQENKLPQWNDCANPIRQFVCVMSLFCIVWCWYTFHFLIFFLAKFKSCIKTTENPCRQDGIDENRDRVCRLIEVGALPEKCLSIFHLFSFLFAITFFLLFSFLKWAIILTGHTQARIYTCQASQKLAHTHHITSV